MPQYTTGELAKLCDVSVRTVQFYDAKDLLPPSALTEGGRRLYADEDLKKLRQICLLKSLGLSLDSIKGVMDSKNPAKMLLLLLDVQLKQIDTEISSRQIQKEAIAIVQENIRNSKIISVNSISDIEQIMNAKQKLVRLHIIMRVVGLIMDLINISTIVLWIAKGIWLPFAIGFPIVVLLGSTITAVYYKNVDFICPECDVKFKPKVLNLIFSRHTLRTRKLKCVNCGYHGHCVEMYSE